MSHRLHHVNWLVHDIDQAIERFELFFGHSPKREYLAGRDVDTARFELGEGYFVLVSPKTPDSTVGKILAEHGEGLFLLSLQLEHVATDPQKQLMSAAGPRKGICDWTIWDVDGLSNDRSVLQLTLENGETPI